MDLNIHDKTRPVRARWGGNGSSTWWIWKIVSLSTRSGPVGQDQVGGFRCRSAAEDTGDGLDQARGHGGFLEVVEVSHQVKGDEGGEKEADGGEAEQTDPESAPLGSRLARDDHGRRRSARGTLVGRPGRGHLAGNGLFKPVVLVLFLGEGRGSHRRGGVLVDILLVDREDFRSAVAVLELEVADRLELDRLVVGGRFFLGDRDVHLEVGIVEDVFLALLDRWRRSCGQRGLGLGGLGLAGLLGGFGLAGLLGAGLASSDLNALISSSLRGASSIES